MDATKDTDIAGLTSGLQTMNLGAMTEPEQCKVIWHYAELAISPESFLRNIDWLNEVIRLKPGQTSVFFTFTYFSGFKKSIPLAEIMHFSTTGAGIAELPRIESLKEWATSDLGLSTIFKGLELSENGIMPGNYIAVPLIDTVNEIHMCIIGFIRHKIGFISRVTGVPPQRFTMFVDLADGFQNRLTITGSVQAIGCNIFKAIFELLKKRPITDYLDLLANLPPTPFIQMVYNIIPYFPELQVIWAVEPREKDQQKIMNINIAPLDIVRHKLGCSEKLQQLHDKWLSKRQNSVLFKSMVSAFHGHRISAKPNIASNTRFSALWPEVMDVVAD